MGRMQVVLRDKTEEELRQLVASLEYHKGLISAIMDAGVQEIIKKHKSKPFTKEEVEKLLKAIEEKNKHSK